MDKLIDNCCIDCFNTNLEAAIAEGRTFARRMILCPVCGNKRCPKATNHTRNCSGSNETGQIGSAYA